MAQSPFTDEKTKPQEVTWLAQRYVALSAVPPYLPGLPLCHPCVSPSECLLCQSLVMPVAACFCQEGRGAHSSTGLAPLRNLEEQNFCWASHLVSLTSWLSNCCANSMGLGVRRAGQDAWLCSAT